MSMRRAAVLGATAVAVISLVGVGCSSSSSNSSSTITSAGSSTSASSSTASTATGGGPIGSGVTAPLVLTASQPSATVKVGQAVVFDMGDPGQGSFVATSDNSAVFRVDSEGKSQGTYTTNAGGVAVAAGTAKVAVSYTGSVNGVGTPTTFTITVE